MKISVKEFQGVVTSVNEDSYRKGYRAAMKDFHGAPVPTEDLRYDKLWAMFKSLLTHSNDFLRGDINLLALRDTVTSASAARRELSNETS